MVVESPCFLSFLSPSFPKFGMTHGVAVRRQLLNCIKTDDLPCTA